MAGDRHTPIPSHTKYAPPTHFKTRRTLGAAAKSAPIPNRDAAIIAVKPTAPPAIVKKVLRTP
jgi:hypothetical protein